MHHKPGSCGPCPFVEAHARTCFRAEQQNTERAQRAALAEKPTAMMVDGQLAAAANKNTRVLATQTRDGARKWQSRR